MLPVVFSKIWNMEHALISRRFPTDPNEYKLYEEIGEGVSATVYRALCIPVDILVAIKVLDLEKCNNDLVCYVLWQISLDSVMLINISMQNIYFRRNKCKFLFLYHRLRSRLATRAIMPP